MSILASAGRAKIYNTDGTGRDTYVSFNSGGFTGMKQNAAAQQSGTFAASNLRVSAQHIARGGGQGSPGKTVHYQVNGTGRDSYIHTNHGGFSSNYGLQNDGERYVQSLRGYPNTSAVTAARSLNTRSPRASRDHFTEGQVNIRSPRAKQCMNELKSYQRTQVDRLAQPKRGSLMVSVNQLEAINRSSDNLRSESPSSQFLRKTTQGAGFGIQRSPSIGGSPTGKSLTLGAVSLKDHLAAQIKSPRGDLSSSRNTPHESSQNVMLSARASRNNNNLLIDQIASARMSMKGDVNDLKVETQPVTSQNKVVRRVNKRRMLAIGTPTELTAVRITNGATYDRYERKLEKQ